MALAHCHEILPLFIGYACHVMSCHVMSCHVMSCHVMSCHVMSCHVMSCHVMSCHVMSCHVTSRHVTSCHVMSCHVMYIRILFHDKVITIKSCNWIDIVLVAYNARWLRSEVRLNTTWGCNYQHHQSTAYPSYKLEYAHNIIIDL